MATVHASDSSFEDDVLKADGPVVVDFWAEWCNPCKMIAPALDEIASEMGGRLTIVKVNIDENPATPSKYGVRGIPTLVLFDGGEEKSRQVGANPKGKILNWIEDAI